MFNPDLIPVLMSLRERTNTIPWVMLTYTDNSEVNSIKILMKSICFCDINSVLDFK